MDPEHRTMLNVVGGLGGGAAPLPPNQTNAVPQTADSQYPERMTASR
jgi:hypothetical protein